MSPHTPPPDIGYNITLKKSESFYANIVKSVV